MADSNFSLQAANMFFDTNDQTRGLRKFRTFIPELVLKKFCGSEDPNLWIVDDENHMYADGCFPPPVLSGLFLYVCYNNTDIVALDASLGIWLAILTF